MYKRNSSFFHVTSVDAVCGGDIFLFSISFLCINKCSFLNFYSREKHVLVPTKNTLNIWPVFDFFYWPCNIFVINFCVNWVTHKKYNLLCRISFCMLACFWHTNCVVKLMFLLPLVWLSKVIGYWTLRVCAKMFVDIAVRFPAEVVYVAQSPMLNLSVQAYSQLWYFDSNTFLWLERCFILFTLLY